MTSLAKKPNTLPSKRPYLNSLGYAYATLGLHAGEARVDAIRHAASVSARSLKQVVTSRDELVRTLADVVTSTYRLLDPRKRVRPVERIQLCLNSERAFELQQKSRRPFHVG